MKLSVLFLSILGLAGCTATQAAPPTSWRVEITSSGGFSGRGVGAYAIGSDGVATAHLITGKRCSWKVTAEDLRRFEDLLSKARPQEWKESYIPANPCCDRAEYSLTVEAGDVKAATKWIDSPPPMPPDLVALSDAILGGEAHSVRMQARERCK